MTNESSIYGFDPAQLGSDRTVKQLRMGGQAVELLDWNELSRLGLLERINREILHPLGLAACRDVESGNSLGALVSTDGAWSYGEPSPAQDLEVSQFLTDVMSAAGLLSCGKRDKGLAERLGHACIKFRTGVDLSLHRKVGGARRDT